MKKKDAAALIAAFKDLSKSAAAVAAALEGTEKKEAQTETPAAPSTDQKTTESAQPVTDEPESTIKFEDIRAVLAGKAGKGFREEVKALLSKHNASCLSELESHPEEFAELMKEAEAIGNA